MIQEKRTTSGFFGICQGCGGDIEGIPVTYIVEFVGFCGHRYYHEGCAPTALIAEIEGGK